MWTPVAADRPSTPDAGTFVQTLNAHASMFDRTCPIAVARAPGRLDLMGGIADYSGSLVLQWPLALAAFAAAQVVPGDEFVTVRTVDAAAVQGEPEVRVPLASLLDRFDVVRDRLRADQSRHWAAYVAGAITVLHQERGVRFDRGVRWLVSSSVPPGKGVSSSAAIEVAAMHALCGLLPIDLDGRELALLCQRVENLVVGAPCGVMDQMTAACGAAGSLVALLCQPAELEAPVALPEEIDVWGIDSGIRHAVTGADYAAVRAGAFMGLRMIGALSEPRTYLANVAVDEWETRFRDRIPESISGAAFLEAYGGIDDSVTAIDPGRMYAVRQPTAHPIYEHERVRRFRALLAEQPLTNAALHALGELMYQSHASYGACGLGTPGTDAIVDLVRSAGPREGLFGAKITGGGSGGTVAVLARRSSDAVIQGVAARYARMTGRPAAVIHGSSEGALRFGRITLRRQDA